MIKCFICLKNFDKKQDFEDYTGTGLGTPPVTCPNANTCAQYSNVPTAFDDRRESLPQYLYPIIGPTESGKSYYLHTVTSNLVEGTYKSEATQLLEQLNIRVNSIHGYELNDIIRLRKNLKKEQLGTTAVNARENNIPIVLAYSQGKGKETKRGDLCFFDLAGGLFHDNSDFIQTDPRIQGANGIFVFIDPFQDEGLNSKIDETFQIERIVNDASNLINNLSRLPRRSRLAAKVDIPIAFCLSMFDLLEHNVPNQIPDVYIQSNQLYTTNNQLNIARINKASRLIEEFINLNASGINPRFIQSKFTNYKWFALSTIGHNEIRDKPDLIDSRGIYAPLFWLLHQNGRIR